MEHNYQSSVSDDYSFSGGGASGYTGTPGFSRRGRGSHQGRARGRYYSNSYSRYPQEGSRHESIDSRKGDTATARSFSDHSDPTYNSTYPAMEDLYDDRPLDEAPPSGEQRQLEDRSRGARSDEKPSNEHFDRSTSHSGESSTGLTGKDPEKLRQKVLESLAEKKKKAAVFMHEGAVKKDGSVDAASSTDSSHENPEREAAVDALLATFGSKGPAPLDKPEPSPRQHRRDTLVERSDPGPRHNENHHRRPSLDQRTHRNNDDLRPAPPRVDRYISKRAYSPRREEFSRTDDRAHRSSEFPVRPDPRDYRGSGEHEKLPRIENHYRDERDRFEDHYSAGKGEVKIKGRAPTNAASERFQAPSVSDGRVDYRAPPRDELYKAPEAQREPPTKDGYDTPRSHRYPPPPMDTDYPSRDYGYAPPPTGRYLPPVDDPRYPPPPPATRGPEADYAAMYYRDLTEWLEITGYHDFSYRTIQLERHRALEASRHYGIPPDDPAYLARHPVPRDELDTRHSRGGPGFTMPPPPPVVGWDERNPPARPVSRGAGYPPPALTPKNRYSDMSPDKNSLKRRISLRDEDIREPPPHSTKAARHAYDDPYRRAASPDKDDKLGMRRSELGRNGNEPSEETDFARRTLAERIGRGRNASPGADSRRRSLSPRGYDSGYQGARRYEGEFRGRGRGRGYGRGGNNNDRDRRGSNGEEHPSPGRGRGFGRGRGRGRGGYGRDYHSPERVRYEQREGPSDDYLSEARNNRVRYFMIKSFNEENVKVAQDECIWATQQKNTEILQEAFEKSEDVILFFSINKSGKFQGYARMEGPPGSAPIPSWSSNLLWESSGPFRIRWISITDISFHRVAHLKNRYNEHQPVLIGRDGQEIDPFCGEHLCKAIDEAAQYKQAQGHDN